MSKSANKKVSGGSYSSHAGTRDYDESDINFDAMFGGEGLHFVPGKGHVRLQDGWVTGEDEDGYYFYNEKTGEEQEVAPLYKSN